MNPLIPFNPTVSALIDSLNHPLADGIQLLRQIILTANPAISENIKWNGPNYVFENQDRITMRIQPVSNTIQLIFHRGSKTLEMPDSKLITNPSQLLLWKTNDRAIASFKNKSEIESSAEALQQIVQEWILVD